MKFDTDRQMLKQEQSDTSTMNQLSSFYLYAPTRIEDTSPTTGLKSANVALKASRKAPQQLMLSRSMEKIILKMKRSPFNREHYLKAEVSTALAFQIRAIRLTRGWSQKDLAKKLNTTQTAVSRMEDPSYGKLTLSTLFELAKAFDTGLEIKFLSFISMVQRTYRPSHQERMVPAFEDEIKTIGFFTEPKHTSSTMIIKDFISSNPNYNTYLSSGNLTKVFEKTTEFYTALQ